MPSKNHSNSRPYQILYEHDGIIVVNKDVGIPTQPTKNKSKTSQIQSLYELLLERFSYVGLHHRLDQSTSGLLIFTTEKCNNRSIAQQIQKKEISRHYTSVVLGKPTEYTGKWTTPVDGKQATTIWTCIKSNGLSSILELQLHTGRKHQIRVQAHTHNFPILGDRRYGAAGNLAKRLCLHAHRLSFVHPKSQKRIDIYSPIPNSMQVYMNNI